MMSIQRMPFLPPSETLNSVSLLQSGAEPEAAIGVSRIWSVDPPPDEVLHFEGFDADAVVIHLAQEPETTFYVDDVPRAIPARERMSCTMSDLRAGGVWRAPHSFDHLCFSLPQVAMERWAEDNGIRRYGGLIYRSGASRVDDVMRSFGTALFPSLAEPASACAIYVDYILDSVCSYLVRTFSAIPIERPRRGGLAPWQERRAKELIEESVAGQLSLSELARQCRLSISHFTKAFKQTTGSTPHQWLLERRVDRALKHLAAGRLSLTEIASCSGFADQSHFTRTFSKSVGVAPGAWRRSMRAIVSTAALGQTRKDDVNSRTMPLRARAPC
jgi:AraC-like DNA-binding protein